MINQPEENLASAEEGLFAEEEEVHPDTQSTADQKWQILIVDDEEDIHQATRFAFALNNYTYQGKPLEFISAYSAQEALTLLQQRPEVALILLDVVMETSDAGLKLAEYIRDTLHNHLVRIILRTGQPGYAPEQEVIVKYEINDYQSKAELSAQKLFTVVIAGIRAYSDLIQLDLLRQHLEDQVEKRTHELQEQYTHTVELNEQLIKLNQEKNEFLGIASHDLKNPLSAIQGLSDMIRSEYGTLPEIEVVDIANNIFKASRQMFELITTFLDVNAIESGHLNLSLSTIDLLPILQTLVKDYSERARMKQITLHFQPTATTFLVWADQNICHQILDNLISNALKYSPLGQNIVIRLSQTEQSVRCEVQDEGPGLNAEDKQKLFKKFTRLSAQPTGKEHSTGLGLFIVNKLVTAINGKVWCESEFGRGATFVVELPVRKI